MAPKLAGASSGERRPCARPGGKCWGAVFPGEGGHIRLEAAAPPPEHILEELRRNRDAVAMLVAERAVREAFYLKAVNDCTIALAVPDPDLARERAGTATATDAELVGGSRVACASARVQRPSVVPHIKADCDAICHRVREAANAAWSTMFSQVATTIVSTDPVAAVARPDALSWMAKSLTLNSPGTSQPSGE